MMDAEQIKGLVEEAKEIAKSYGELIGYVDYAEPVEVSAERRLVAIEIPADAYLAHEINIGDFLLIVAAARRRLILGRAVAVEREHLLAKANVAPLSSDWHSAEEYSGLLTPAKIKLELITECDAGSCDPRPVYTPIDPLSPVAKPKPDAVAELLGLPKEGVLLGKLYAGGRELAVEVRLPEHSLYEHLLVVGTTGSGKTVLLKNLALSAHLDVGASVVAFDLQGDYLHMTLPGFQYKGYRPLEKLTAVWPVTSYFVRRRYEDVRTKAEEALWEGLLGEAAEFDGDYSLDDISDVEEYARYVLAGMARLFVEESYPGADVLKLEPVVEKIDEGTAKAKRVDMELKVGDTHFELSLYPWALRFEKVAEKLPYLLTTFTEKVTLLFPKIVEQAKGKLQKQRGGELTLQRLLDNLENVTSGLPLHRQQVENIARSLYAAHATGIFDVEWFKKESAERKAPQFRVIFDEPDYGALFQGFVDVDLRLFREEPTAASIVVYRLLSSLFDKKDEEFSKGRAEPTLVLIDEAHNYFPQTGREVGKDVVESMINKLTRLGRVRRLGVVFATHTPADLNSLVLQLTNTKIGLRSDVDVLEKIGLKDYAGDLLYALDGVGVAKSYVFRTHAVMFRSLPPLVRHRSHKDQSTYRTSTSSASTGNAK